MRISSHNHFRLLKGIRRGRLLPSTPLSSFPITATNMYGGNGSPHREKEDDGAGASLVFVIRHAERLDRADPSWSSLALRPQDTPLSEVGKHQAKRLGKW